MQILKNLLQNSKEFLITTDASYIIIRIILYQSPTLTQQPWNISTHIHNSAWDIYKYKIRKKTQRDFLKTKIINPKAKGIN